MKITVVNLEEGEGEKIQVNAFPWSTVNDLKSQIQNALHVKAAKQRLFFGGRELRSKDVLSDVDVNDASVLYLAPVHAACDGLLQLFAGIPCPVELQKRIAEARKGLQKGLVPKLSSEGLGGTYFLKNREGTNVLVFKPEDEEPFTPNNKKGYVGEMGQQSMRVGIVSGEGNLREIAAFLLDHHQFASVPQTSRAEMSASMFKSAKFSAKNAVPPSPRLTSMLDFGPSTFSYDFEPSSTRTPKLPSSSAASSSHLSLSSLGSPSPKPNKQVMKIGSIQEFVDFDEVSSDVAPQQFPIREVHKIGILDIRIFNLDRNDANILVKRVSVVEEPSKKEEKEKEKEKEKEDLKEPKSPSRRSADSEDDAEESGGASGSSSADEEDGDRRPRRASRRPQKTTIRLIPIDHTYSLPDTLEIGWTDWCWLEWPQCKKPFDEETKAYIASLDIEADIAMLRSHLAIREPCLKTMRITGMLLKQGAAAGLTLHQIASIICRNDLDKCSELEIACQQAATFVQGVLTVPNSLSLLQMKRSISYSSFQEVQLDAKGFELQQLIPATNKKKAKKAASNNNNSNSKDAVTAPSSAKNGRSLQVPAGLGADVLERCSSIGLTKMQEKTREDARDAVEKNKTASLPHSDSHDLSQDAEADVVPPMSQPQSKDELFFGYLSKLMDSLIERKNPNCSKSVKPAVPLFSSSSKSSVPSSVPCSTSSSSSSSVSVSVFVHSASTSSASVRASPASCSSFTPPSHTSSSFSTLSSSRASLLSVSVSSLSSGSLSNTSPVRDSPCSSSTTSPLRALVLPSSTSTFDGFAPIHERPDPSFSTSSASSSLSRVFRDESNAANPTNVNQIKDEGRVLTSPVPILAASHRPQHQLLKKNLDRDVKKNSPPTHALSTSTSRANANSNTVTVPFTSIELPSSITAASSSASSTSQQRFPSTPPSPANSKSSRPIATASHSSPALSKLNHVHFSNSVREPVPVLAEYSE